MSHKSFIKKCNGGGGVTPSSEQVSSNLGGEISRHTDEQHLQGDTDISRHSEEQHLQSAECRLKTRAVCKTFQPNEDTFNANVVIGNEESQNREDFTNNAILRGLNNCSPQKDETKHVIVSDSETIQSMDNQKPLQGKIDSLRETSCPPLAGGPKSMISRRGKINCHVEENGSLSLNNFVEAIPLTCTPKVRFSSLRTASSPARGEGFLDAHWENSRKIASTLAEGATHVANSNNSRKVAFTEPSRGMSEAKVEQTSAETLSFRCVCERCRLTRGEVVKPKCKVAFTLAETLITLGIIGVVAALTLPSLIHRYQSEILKNQFKKSYSILSQATLAAREELGVGDFASYCATHNGTTDGYVNRAECMNVILKQLKKTGKSCNYDKSKTYTYSKTQTNARVDIGATAYPTYKLPDGSCVGVSVNAYRIGVSVDINGVEKGPNALGHDIFSFWANASGALVPIKMTEFKDDDQLQDLINKCSSDDYTTNACASAAQQKGFPCTKKSNQKGNGLGCSWYALNDVSPDDSSKGYWESLPR